MFSSVGGGSNSYHEEGGVICVGGASGGIDGLNKHQTKTHRHQVKVNRCGGEGPIVKAGGGR